MTRGRKPKGAHLAAVDGDTRKQKAKPKVDAAPVCPDRPKWDQHLPGRSNEAKRLREDATAMWDAIVPELHRLELLTRLDDTILIDACLCRARLRQCERILTTDGLTIEGPRGLQKHPALTAANQYRGQLRFYIGELGLAPAARTRLDMSGSDEPDDDDDLFD